jgi:hypothetical protein
MGKKMGDCLQVATLPTTAFDPFVNIYYICKSNNTNSYNKLNKHFGSEYLPYKYLHV